MQDKRRTKDERKRKHDQFSSICLLMFSRFINFVFFLYDETCGPRVVQSAFVAGVPHFVLFRWNKKRGNSAPECRRHHDTCMADTRVQTNYINACMFVRCQEANDALYFYDSIGVGSESVKKEIAFKIRTEAKSSTHEHASKSPCIIYLGRMLKK